MWELRDPRASQGIQVLQATRDLLEQMAVRVKAAVQEWLVCLACLVFKETLETWDSQDRLAGMVLPVPTVVLDPVDQKEPRVFLGPLVLLELLVLQALKVLTELLETSDSRVGRCFIFS